MNKEIVEKEFKKKVCSEVRLLEEGMERYRIFTPFQFDDGDHLAMVLKKRGTKWHLTDEGHTFMHLSYTMDIDSLEKGTRAKIIGNTLANLGVTEADGALTVEVDEENSGNVFYDFVQALIKISDITYLSRERTRSTFMEDFKEFLEQKISKERLTFNYNVKNFDPQGKYPVDCRVNGMEKPLFIFGIPGDDKCRDATISILQYEKWNISFRSLSIFEDQEEISKKVLARFSDVVEKQFSSLAANKERIEKYLSEII